MGYWKRNSPGQKVPNMPLEISGEITPERMKGWSQSKNNAQLWMGLVIEARSDVVKSNIAQEPGMLDPSVQFSCSVMSDSLWPHESQNTRPICPSPTPGVYSNSCPVNRWCHPNISSSIITPSSCLQSFPAWKFFQMSQFCTSGGQSIGVSPSESVLPMNIQDWFPLGWTCWVS